MSIFINESLNTLNIMCEIDFHDFAIMLCKDLKHTEVVLFSVDDNQLNLRIGPQYDNKPWIFVGCTSHGNRLSSKTRISVTIDR